MTLVEVSTGEWIDQLQLRQVLKLWQQQALQELGNPWGFSQPGNGRSVGGLEGWNGLGRFWAVWVGWSGW